MERFCDTCGSLINGAVTTCPFCGTVQEVSVVSLNKQNTNAPVQQFAGATSAGVSAAAGRADNYNNNNVTSQPYTGYVNNVNSNITPQQPQAQVQSMTTGQWLGTILLTNCLGIVSFILLLIWGFANDSTEPRRSYSRAVLAIQVAIVALLIVIFTLMLISAFNESM